MFGFLMAISGIGVVAIFVMLYLLKKGETILVNYSEVVGNKIIEHKQTYTGNIDPKNDLMIISKLKLKRPIPPSKVCLPTNEGKKMVYLIKIDEQRFAYRLPSLNNEVIVEKRDEKGNILLNSNNKPILTKLNWVYADSFYEPEITHWAEAEIIKSEQRHKDKMNFWEKFGAPISLMVIFLFGLIAFNIMSKNFQTLQEMYIADKEELFKEAKQVQTDAQRTQHNLNALMEKITGQRVFEDTSQREQFINSTR